MHLVTLMAAVSWRDRALDGYRRFRNTRHRGSTARAACRHTTARFLAPLFQVPNFFCNLVTLIKPWVAGAIMVGLLAVACGFGLRFVMPEASMQLTNGLKGVGRGAVHRRHRADPGVPDRDRHHVRRGEPDLLSLGSRPCTRGGAEEARDVLQTSEGLL